MNEHHHRIPIVLIIALFAVAFACMFVFLKNHNTAKQDTAVYSSIASEFTETGSAPAPDVHETALLPYTIPDFDALRGQNPDTIGWIAIPGTEINYPVMQYTDNYKYLRYDSSGKKSSAGAPFIDCNNVVDPLDKNTVIYAHNMGAGRESEMFGPLLAYKEKEHYENHKWVQFDTYLQTHGWWEVFAVIYLNLGNADFDYLRLEFENNDDFMDWVRQAKSLALYDTGIAVQESDFVVTLSTCDRSLYGKSGRLVVIAVKRGLN